MALGASGTYAIDSVTVARPTSGQWIDREDMGYDGNAHPIYPAVRNFELNWNLMSASEFEQIYNAYLTVSNTGTVSWDLPQLGASGYTFKTFSGTTMNEPSVGKYFMGWVEDVTLLILNVRT